MRKLMITTLLPVAMLLLLASCAPANKSSPDALMGLSGASLKFAALTNLGVEPSSGLEPIAAGRKNVLAKTSTSTRSAATVRYILYARQLDNDSQALAHAFVSTLDNKDLWEYTKETFARNNEVYLIDKDLDGVTWKEHLLFEKSDQDWVSALWAGSGRKIPEVWIAKRWSKTLRDYQRIVLEYREPMPACVHVHQGLGNIQQSQVSFETANTQCAEDLKGFYERADAAFKISSSNGLGFSGLDATAEELDEPDQRFNFERLVGGVKTSTKADRVLFKTSP